MLLTHDWSRSALFLRTHAPLPVGATVQLSMIVPGQRHPVNFSGKVTRIVTAHDCDGDRPPGMAVTIEHLPIALSVHLSGLIAKQQLLRPPQAPSAVQPPLLLFGGTGLERLKYSIYLEANGFSVTNAESLDEAALALAGGLRPRILVVVGEASAAVELERRAKLGGHSKPDVTIIIGSMPGFVGGVEHAVMALPRETTPENLLAHLKGELAVPPELLVPQPPTE